MTAPTDAGTSGWEAARAEGIRLLEERDFTGAAKRLADAASGDPGGESEALLGLTHFHSERYDDAARHYARALQVVNLPARFCSWRMRFSTKQDGRRCGGRIRVADRVTKLIFFTMAPIRSRCPT